MILIILFINILFILVLLAWWHFYFFDDSHTKKPKKIKFYSSKEVKINLLELGIRKATSEINQTFNQLTIEAAHDAFVGIDSRGMIIDWNREAETLFGWEKEKVIGKSFIEQLLSPRHRFFYQEALQRFLETGKGPLFKKRVETIAVRHGGEEFPIELILWKITMGNFHRYNAFIHDISDRKRLEKLKEDFVSTVSHELRTPLSILRGAISNLEDGAIGSLTEKQLKVIQTAHRNADRLSHLIDDLLDLSRLESGRTQLHRTRFNPIPLIQEVVHGFQLTAQKRNLSFQAILPNELPDLYADPHMFVQILNNLLDNATRFAKKEILLEIDPGRKVLESKIDFSSQLKFSRFSITNDGPSIPKEDLPKLFSKFQQLNRSPGGVGYQGTGLGLAICKGIIDQHRGKIGVENKKPEGISFYFELPEYDDEISIRVSLDKMIDETERNKSVLSILVLSLLNAEMIRKQFGSESLEETFLEIEKKIQTKILRKEDGFFLSPPNDFIFLLPGLESYLGSQFQDRLLKELEGIRCQKRNLSIIPCFGLGLATYPSDGTKPEKLLAQAIEDANENSIKKGIGYR